MTYTNAIAVVTSGSTVQTKSNSLQAKDGRWYPTYMEKVTANRAYNDAVLKSKGLLETVATIKKQQQRRTKVTTSTTNNNKNNASENRHPRIVTPVRRSSRISTKDDPTAPKRKFQALEFHADDTPILQPNRRDQEGHLVSTSPPPPAKKPQQRRTPQTVVSYEYNLSDQEALALQQLDPNMAWLNDMDHWLRTVPHGNAHKVVSADNARSVMNQVRNLVAGEGVTYHHWPSSVSFKKGSSIHLGQNMEELYQEAQDMEDRHGRDLGNGWLLRHPIRKLQLYQDYRRWNLSESRR
jgi:hypothetical protein